MWETIAPPMLGILLYVLTVWTAQCFTEGRTGGIPEEEAEDEKID